MWTAKTHCKLAKLILKIGQRFFSKSVLFLVCWTDNRKTELSLDPCSFSVCWNEFGTKSRFSTWACPSLAVSGPGWGHLFNTAFQNDCWILIRLQHFFQCWGRAQSYLDKKIIFVHMYSGKDSFSWFKLIFCLRLIFCLDIAVYL